MLLRCQLPFRVWLARIYQCRPSLLPRLSPLCGISVHSSSTLEMKNKSQANSLVLLPTSGYFWDDGGLATFCCKMIQKRYAVSRSQSSSGFQSVAIKFSRPVIARFEAVPSVNLALHHAKTFFPPLCSNSKHNQIIWVYHTCSSSATTALLLLAGDP